jgi:hypothetical protein
MALIFFGTATAECARFSGHDGFAAREFVRVGNDP